MKNSISEQEEETDTKETSLKLSKEMEKLEDDAITATSKDANSADDDEPKAANFADEPSSALDAWDSKISSWDDEGVSSWDEDAPTWEKQLEEAQSVYDPYDPNNDDYEDDSSYDEDSYRGDDYYEDEEEEEEENKSKFGDKTMPFWKHLEEMRWMIVKSVIALMISTTLGLMFVHKTEDMICRPIDKANAEYNEKRRNEFLSIKPEKPKGIVEKIVNLFGENRTLIDKSVKNRPKAVQDNLDFIGPLPLNNSAIMSIADMPFTIIFLEDGESSDKQESKVYLPKLLVEVVYTHPIDAFIIQLKLAVFGGIAFSLPFVLMFIWSFVAPGLTKRERRPVWFGIIAGFFFFLIGIFVGYNFLSMIVSALLKFANPNVKNLWHLSKWMGFCFKLMLGFGVVFELPVFLTVLIRMGAIKVQTLKKYRAYAVVISCVVAAILTPPDIVSMVSLAAPMLFLYEGTIIFATFLNRLLPIAEEDDEDEAEENSKEID